MKHYKTKASPFLFLERISDFLLAYIVMSPFFYFSTTRELAPFYTDKYEIEEITQDEFDTAFNKADNNMKGKGNA